jgi:hypothetical protein
MLRAIFADYAFSEPTVTWRATWHGWSATAREPAGLGVQGPGAGRRAVFPVLYRNKGAYLVGRLHTATSNGRW